MKLPQYKTLSPLNKFFYLFAVAGFVGLALTIGLVLFSSGETTIRVHNPQTHGDHSPQYIGGDNTTFNITEGQKVAKSGNQSPTRAHPITAYVGVGVIGVVVIFALLFVRKGGGRTTTAVTTGDNSPQYIGGDNSTFNVGNHSPSTAQAIVEQNKSLHSQLSEEYPFGWILFNQDRAGRFDPIFSRDLKCEADWTETQLELDTTKKTFSLVLPHLNWSRERQLFNVSEGRKRPYKGTYKIGNSTLVRTMVWVEGEPLVHLEILDDTARAPVYVIGFKKQPPDSEPPPYDFKESNQE